MTTNGGMIAGIFDEAVRNLGAVSEQYIQAVEHGVALLVKTFRAGNKALVFGNGGSAADAEHICGELVGRFLRERRPLPAMALSSNPAILTALSNDCSFENVFERQIQAYGKPGDVAWAISTSGHSKNVIRALEMARAQGLSTMGLAGNGGGSMAQLCDVLVAIESRSAPRVQEVHVVTYHAICEAVEDALFAPG